MTTKKDHPPRMMTSKEDYDHKNLDDAKLEKLKNLGYKKFYSNLKNLPIVIKSFLSLLRH